MAPVTHLLDDMVEHFSHILATEALVLPLFVVLHFAFAHVSVFEFVRLGISRSDAGCTHPFDRTDFLVTLFAVVSISTYKITNYSIENRLVISRKQIK